MLDFVAAIELILLYLSMYINPLDDRFLNSEPQTSRRSQE